MTLRQYFQPLSNGYPTPQDTNIGVVATAEANFCVRIIIVNLLPY